MIPSFLGNKFMPMAFALYHPGKQKRWILVKLPPLPHPRFRFHQNVVILLVAIPPTYLEAAASAIRFRFQNPNSNLSNFL